MYIHTSELILEPFDDPCFDWKLGQAFWRGTQQVQSVYIYVNVSFFRGECVRSIHDFPQVDSSLRNLTGSSTARQSPFDSEEVGFPRKFGEVKAAIGSSQLPMMSPNGS